jgi:hypothetical protein
VPGGPLDNGAWVAGVDPETGEPRTPILAPIEVKNIRTELYPRHHELYQLLDKASQLQSAEPDRAILPTLVCRDRHYTLDRMSRDLGFRVINIRKQYIKVTADVDPAVLGEIQTELGFRDLTPAAGPDRELVRAFSHLPHEARTIAATWGEVGAELGQFYVQLRKDNLSDTERQSWLDDLKQEVRDMLEDVRLQW